MNNPLVSIIIPTYNRAHLIGETLNSILGQTYENWECIIVDDGSTDDTDEVVGKYVNKDIRFQFHSRPTDRTKGANSCRNYGFALSKGEYINWFDSDDLMHKEKLSIQISILLKSEISFCVCQSAFFKDDIKQIIGYRHKIYSVKPLDDYIKGNIAWSTLAPLWDKSFLISNNLLFDERLRAAQEWDFHLRALLITEKFKFQEDSLVFIRKHLNNITGDENNNCDTKLNYYYARKKMQNILFNEELLIYYEKDFKNYYSSLYKYFLKNKYIKGTYIILRQDVAPVKSLYGLLVFLVASVFYVLLKRGGRFLKI